MVLHRRKRRQSGSHNRRKLRFEALEERLPFDVNDSLSEAISLGAVSTTPQTTSGTISPDTDVTMYRFTVAAGQTVDFDIDTPLNGPGGLGSFLRLFNSSGFELSFNNDGRAPGELVLGFDAYLRFTFNTAGTYYLGVSNANNTLYSATTGNGDVSGGANATGSYQLSVQALPVDTDDSLTEALVLGAISPTPAVVNGSITPDIDVDLYRFTVAAGQVVDFDIDTPQNGVGGLGSFLRVFNSVGFEIAFNDDGVAPGETVLGFDAYLRFTFATAGTYYVGVSNGTNTLYNANTGGNDAAGGLHAIGAYTLSVQTVAAVPVDADDSLSEAIPLAVSTTPVVVNGSISPDVDVDLYRFTVTAGQVVDFDIDTSQNGPGGLGSFLRLFNAAGQEIAFNDDAIAPGELVLGFDAYLRFTFATAGTYYLGVSNANNRLYNATTGDGDVAGGASATGTYQLIVQALPVDPDDSLTEAPFLGAIGATPAVVNATITPDIDVDLYRFTVAAGQVVDFDIDTPQNGPGGLGSFLRLFNAAGQEIAFNDNAVAPGETALGFDAYLRFTFTAAGTYYVGVSNGNNTLYNPTTGSNDAAGGLHAIGDYQLTVNTAPVAPVDPDDTLVEATSLGAVSTTAIVVNDSISLDTDVDLYRFTVAAGQTVDFDIDTPLNGPGGLGSFLRLFNSSGFELSFNNDGRAPGELVLGFDAYLRFTFNTAGTYYLGISNANNTLYSATTGNGDVSGGANATGSYQLSVQALPVDTDDSLTEALVLGAISPTPAVVNGSITPDIDVDLYRFTVAAGQVVDFDIDTPQNGVGGLGSFLRVFNSVGFEIAFNDDGVAPGETVLGFDAYLRFTFATAGTYYVGVSNGTNTLYNANTGGNDAAGGLHAIGAYTLTVQAAPASPIDADDSLSEAIPLAVSTTPVVVNGSISPDVDVDLYRFTVTAGQVVDFDIDTPQNGPGGLGSFLRLFNATGQEIAFNDDAIAPGELVLGFDAYLRFTFATAGTYYLGVSNANNRLYNATTGDGDVAGGANATGTYQLIVQALPVDPDDSLTEAPFLGAIGATPAVVNATITPDIDVDLYRFTVAAGQVIDFDIDTPQNGVGGLVSFLRLFNAAGQEIAFNDNAVAPGETALGFDAYLRFTFTAAGTYYVGISNGTNTLYNANTGGNDAAGGLHAIGDYQLSVQTAIDIPADPDDTLAEATFLGTISVVPSVVNASITPDFDVDLYRFTVNAGQVIDFDIDTPLNGPGGLGSFLRLFNAAGQEVSSNNNAAAPGENVLGFDAYLRFTFATAGTYYIGVSNANNTLYNVTSGSGDFSGGVDATGSYQLIAQTLPVDTDDALTEATFLGAVTTTPATFSASIFPDIDVDMFRFTVAAGQAVDFDIDTTLNGPGGLGSFLRLFNAQGQELAFNNNAAAPGESVIGLDAYLRFTFTTAGTYYVGVSNSNNTLYNANSGDGDAAGGQNSIGDYQLIVQAVPVGAPALTLSTNVSSIPELNGTAIGTVTRTNADIGQAIVVSLSSSDTGAATVPPSVTIPANQASATFTISAVQSSTRGTTSVTITAATAGFAGGSVSLLVTDSDRTWQNPVNPLDVDNDGELSPIDAVLIVNYLNNFGPGPTPVGTPPPYLDVNGDNSISPVDAALVINALNNSGAPLSITEFTAADPQSGDGSLALAIRSTLAMEAAQPAPLTNSAAANRKPAFAEQAGLAKESLTSADPGNPGRTIDSPLVPTSDSARLELVDAFFTDLESLPEISDNSP